MSTILTEPPQIQSEQDKRNPKSSNGGGGFRNLNPDGTALRSVEDHSANASKTGVLLGAAAITMTFAALTSALFVRQGAANDWRHLQVPLVLYFNTFLLIISSVTLEFGRHSAVRSENDIVVSPTLGRWLQVTLLLGCGFVAGQHAAWLQLRAAGLYLATNPNSSFFYLLTVLHALHLLGGLGVLVMVVGRARRFKLRRSTLDSVSYYWHFMGALWIYLLVVIVVKL